MKKIALLCAAFAGLLCAQSGNLTIYWIDTEGGADESGYKFSWGDTLRDPVIEAVTGAGWTYKPKRI